MNPTDEQVKAWARRYWPDVTTTWEQYRAYYFRQYARWIREGRPKCEPANGLLDLLASGDNSVEIRVTKRPS